MTRGGPWRPALFGASVVKKGKPIVLGIVLLLLAGGTFLVYRSWSGSKRLHYRTVRIERGLITSTTSATGTLNAVVTVQVGSQLTGMVKDLYADFNARVKRGQLIARIDPATFEARLQQAKADLENARANVMNQRAAVAKTEAQMANARAALEAAKANLVRAEVGVRDARIKYESRAVLFKEGGISQEEYDSAQANYDSAVAGLEAAQAQRQAAEALIRSAEAELQVAKAQLVAAEAAVEQKKAAVIQAQVDLDHTYIRAPVDGVVISRNVDVGQTVAASLQAPTLFVIAQDLTRMQVNASVSEADVSKVQVGQEATFTVDAFPGQTFTGMVFQIRKAPVIQQNVVTYDVIIRVDNPDLKLLPGMTANVSMLVAKRENVLKLPLAALRFRPEDGGGRPGRGLQAGEASSPKRGEQDETRVWILAEGRLRPIPVKLGISDGNFIEILGGDLKEGQGVIVGVGTKPKVSEGSPFGARRFLF